MTIFRKGSDLRVGRFVGSTVVGHAADTQVFNAGIGFADCTPGVIDLLTLRLD
jgi:hypothetical protein